MSAPNGRGPSERGFTLIELLVAMTLLGLVMVALAGGLRFGVRAWERGDRQSARVLDVHAAQTAIRRQLGQALPLAVPSAGASGVTLAFVGQRDHVRFVAPVPAEVGGGLHGFALRLDGDPTGARLVLEHNPVPAGPGAPWAGAERDVVELLPGTASLTLAYFGSRSDGEPPGWHATWTDAPVLPRLVRVAVTFGTANSMWPELVVALKVTGPPMLAIAPTAGP